MKTLTVFIFAIVFFYASNCAHLHNRREHNKDVSSLINEVESYVNDIGELINDVKQLQDPKRRKKKPRKIDLSGQDGTGVEQGISHNPIRIDEEICRQKRRRGEKCVNEGNDMRFPPREGNAKRAVPETARRWPYGTTIWYRFQPGHFSEDKRNIIRGAIQHLNEKFDCGDIKWEEDVNGNKGYYVRFQNTEGCWSYVGYLGPGRLADCNNCQPISLQNNGCVYNETILHEMMHAMGFAHEQNRPDRDKFVRVEWSNVDPKNEHNFKAVSQRHSESLPSTYDFRSVMHYPSNAFGVDRNKNTMVAISGGQIDNGKTQLMGRATDMSASDVEELRHLYQCGASTGTDTGTTTTATTTTTTTTAAPTGTVENEILNCDSDRVRCEVTAGPIPSGSSFYISASNCNTAASCNAEFAVTAQSSSGKICYSFDAIGAVKVAATFKYQIGYYTYINSYTLSQGGGEFPYLLYLTFSKGVEVEVEAKFKITDASNGRLNDIKVLRNC